MRQMWFKALNLIQKENINVHIREIHLDLLKL